jgi:nicotinate-nucleotide adenylyltransferase
VVVVMGARLGVLGGTFDPIHWGHLLLAELARESLRLEKVLFAPVGIQPLKLDASISPVEERLEMLRLAVQDNPHFAVTRIDIDRPGPHYSFEMTRLLRREFGLTPDELFLIIGADSLQSLQAWKSPDQLIRECRLAVAGRTEAQVDMARLESAIPGLAGRVTRIDMPLIEISAREIRSRLKEQKTIRYMVPDSVLEFIRQNKLYQR